MASLDRFGSQTKGSFAGDWCSGYSEVLRSTTYEPVSALLCQRKLSYYNLCPSQIK